MTSPLTVHNAEINTVTIEIKTMTVGRRQVTQALFRQLLEQPLISGDGALNGIPWGTVNYHPDKCADTNPHLHVVWQDGDQLRRSLVRKPAWSPFWDESCEPFVQAMFCQNEHKRLSWMQRGRNYEEGSWEVRFRFDDMQCCSDEPTAPWRKGDHDHVCRTAVDLGESRLGLSESVAEEKARRVRHWQRWHELQELPQLFIAV